MQCHIGMARCLTFDNMRMVCLAFAGGSWLLRTAHQQVVPLLRAQGPRPLMCCNSDEGWICTCFLCEQRMYTPDTDQIL
jgi:hypothetical protein